MKNKLLIISLSLSLFFLNGCKKILSKKNIQHGIATFAIKYETTKEQNPIVILLPNKMNTYFQNNKTATIVEGFFGTFKMIMLSRPDINRKYTIIRVLDKKYIYETDLKGKPFASGEMQDMKITFLDTNLTYKGFRCKVAAVHCPSIQPDTFWVYYTKDISIRYANVNTPYYKIPGVLLKFKLKLLGIVMDINLDKIKNDKFDSSILEVPKQGYKYVDFMQLQQILKSLQ